MDEAKKNFYLNKIPREIRNSIKQLDNDQKWAIYLLLMFSGRKSFTEIKEEFSANANEINRALESLSNGGLVSKRIERMSNIGDRGRYLYYSTAHGRNLLERLFETIPTKNDIARTDVTQYRDYSSSTNEKKIWNVNAKSSFAQNNESPYTQLIHQEE